MEERRLSREIVENVVKYSPTEIYQYDGKSGGRVYKFSKKVDSVTVIVVAEIVRTKRQTKCVIVTAFKK